MALSLAWLLAPIALVALWRRRDRSRYLADVARLARRR